MSANRFVTCSPSYTGSIKTPLAWITHGKVSEAAHHALIALNNAGAHGLNPADYAGPELALRARRLLRDREQSAIALRLRLELLKRFNTILDFQNDCVYLKEKQSPTYRWNALL